MERFVVHRTLQLPENEPWKLPGMSSASLLLALINLNTRKV
jgi:hypothetical protein